MNQRNRVNKYTCQVCGNWVVTVDVDDGHTPFMIRCTETKDCSGMMQSGFYTCEQTLEPAYEWRKPTKTEYFQLPMTAREYVDQGGLMIYLIKRPLTPMPKAPVEPKKGHQTAKRRRMRDRLRAREGVR